MILCQLSGGYDSVAALIKLINSKETVVPVFIDYGQSYYKNELDAVRYVLSCFEESEYLLPLEIIETDIKLTVDNGDTVSDYIPVRNLVLASLTANLAISRGINTFAVGNKTTEVRENDPWSFSDCSVNFYKMFSDLVTFCSEGDIKFNVIMPLIENGIPMTKTQVIKLIIESGLNISKLWSCYSNNNEPCGVCYHCKENIKSLKELDLL